MIHTGMFFEVHNWLYGIILASARLMPAFFLLPFFNSNTLVGTTRMPVAIIIGASLWPHSIQELPNYDMLYYVGMLIKEVLIGALLAFFFCLPFWVLHATGSMIDNQRGATLSSSIDPLSGVDTSELANLFNLFAAVIVLESGGLTMILEVYKSSYQLWDPLSFHLPKLTPAISFLTKMVASALILSSPVLISFLLVEFLLGLLSRFAPQMNAFSIALTIKSSVAFIIIIMYFTSVIPSKVISLRLRPEILCDWLK